MRVTKIYQKGSGQMNEDQLLIKGNLFAVFDGVTGLVPYRDRHGRTGGQIAAGIARDAFANNDRPLMDLARRANQKILGAMKHAHIVSKAENRWAVMMAAIRIDVDCFEYLSIGDVLIMTISTREKSDLVVPYHNHDLPVMRKWKKLAEQHAKNIWTVLYSDILRVRRAANRAYGMLNGDPRAVRFFRSGKHELTRVQSIIIFTDGLHLPQKYPQRAPDWEKFAAHYKRRGLKGLIRYVRAIERSDPNCWKYPRYKKHDDIAAIGIEFV